MKEIVASCDTEESFFYYSNSAKTSFLWFLDKNYQTIAFETKIPSFTDFHLFSWPEYLVNPLDTQMVSKNASRCLGLPDLTSWKEKKKEKT